jgi:ribonuclease HI
VNLVTIYTDGACSGNPGPGGWAWAVSTEEYDSGADPATTNQRMEIMAAYKAVKKHAESHDQIEIISDSTYVVNCFVDKWYVGWQQRGWKNSARKPVANRDLWEPFIELVLDHGNVSFAWVKGHSGHDMNDFVDRLAVAASLGT